MFEGELSHLHIWWWHKFNRRNASPSSQLAVCPDWLQTPQEHFSSMHCILYILPTVLVQGNLCVHSHGLPGPFRGWITGQSPQIWWPQATTFISHAAGTIPGHWAHFSCRHSYRTYSQLWARRCRLRWCHLLHPDKTPVPACSHVRWREMKVSIGMQLVFCRYTYFMYN